jgi:hypothetical protein
MRYRGDSRKGYCVSDPVADLQLPKLDLPPPSKIKQEKTGGKNSYKKSSGGHQAKKKREEKTGEKTSTKPPNPRNRTKCHSNKCIT